MKWWTSVFALMAIGATGAALAHAPTPTPGEEKARLVHILVDKGFTVNARRIDTGILTVIDFSSAGCRNMKMIPVSVILQESVLLKDVGAPDAKRYFVYMGQHWQTSHQPPVALKHVLQQVLDIARAKPRPAIDTMLYLVVPKNCPAPTEWSQFWQPDQSQAARP